MSATPDGAHGRDDEVPDLRGGEGGAGRLGVGELADEDHVGVLAEPAAQRGGVAGRVRADLALGDDRLGVGVEDLDRVLDREDVAGAPVVDPVDEGGDGGRLARSRADPVTSTRPFSSSAKRSTCGGRPSSSRSGISGGTRRTTMASEPALAVDGHPEATEAGDAEPDARPRRSSASSSWRGASRTLGGQRLDHPRGRARRRAPGCSWPSTRTWGTVPGFRCRSDPRTSCRYVRSSSSWVIWPTSARPRS